MGTVYLARDRRLGRRVALKFLHPDGTVIDPSVRLLREAQAASTLNHPNICQIYDVGSEGQTSWIAMEYVEGRPLSASIASPGVPPGDAVRIVQTVAEALAHAHARGMFGVRCSVFGVRYSVRCSVFGVRCSVFGVRCSVFGVRYSVFGSVFGVRYSRTCARPHVARSHVRTSHVARST